MRFDATQEQLDMVREITESMSDPVFLVDKAFNVWFHNRAFEALVGIRMSSKRYKGTPCHQLLGLEICGEHCVMRQVIESGQNVRLAEISGKTADGELHNFNINAVPMINHAGTAFGALIFLRDTTAETRIHKKYKELVARNTAVALSGRLERGNLVDIIQLVSFLQKTGRLTLSAQGQEGEIWFRSGQIVSIRLAPVEGEKALGRLLTWLDGVFTFQPDETIPVVERPLGKSSDFMLMDGVREKDELGARIADLPGPAVVPTVLAIANREDEYMNDLLWRTYESGLQGLSVGATLDGQPETDAQVYFALLTLREKGVLRW